MPFSEKGLKCRCDPFCASREATGLLWHVTETTGKVDPAKGLTNSEIYPFIFMEHHSVPNFWKQKFIASHCAYGDK